MNVTLFDDGTKIRETDDDEFRPEYPENCDMTISTVCNNGCKYCYMNCTPDGMNADFDKYDFLDNMFPGMELAINMNFPPHPDLYKFLVRMKEQGVYVNATINETHFMQPTNRKWLKGLVESHLLWGIGVSYVGKSNNEEFIAAVNEFPTAIVHLIAGLIDSDVMDRLGGHGLKILILGYKDVGRGVKYLLECGSDIIERINWLTEALPDLIDEFKLVSFDNAALDQLRVKKWIDPDVWKERYQGEEGSQTFYIDLVHDCFARDSLTDMSYPIENKSLKEMFDHIRFAKSMK